MTPDPMDLLRQEAGRRRMADTRAQLERHDLDVLLVFGSGRHHFITTNLCWWLSGVRQLGRDALVAVTREGEALLVTSPSWDAARNRRRGWIDDVVAVDDLAAALPELARERGWRDARVGIAGSPSLSNRMTAALGRALPRPPAPADDALRAALTLHDDYALALIERSVQIAEAGYRHLLDVAVPGLPEYELHAEIDAHMRGLGADDVFLFVTSSQHNHAVHPPTDRELALGDVLIAEMSPGVGGQFAQICRSAVIGPPTDDQLDAYDVLRTGYAAGLAAAGPGVAVRDVCEAVNQAIAARGFGTYNHPPYMRTRGHGMGLGGVVPVDVSPQSDVVLEPRMSFVLHPNQYFPGPGYFLCGNQLVVTQDGIRVLADELPTLGVIEDRVAA